MSADRPTRPLLLLALALVSLAGPTCGPGGRRPTARGPSGGAIFDERAITAELAQGQLRIAVPFACTDRCGGTLRIAVRTLDGQVVAAHETALREAVDDQVHRVRLPVSLPLPELELGVLHFAHLGPGGTVRGAIPLGDVLRGPELRYLGTGRVAAGSQAVFRIVTRNTTSGLPYAGAPVRAEWRIPGQPPLSGAAVTRPDGSADLVLPAPPVERPLTSRLRVVARTADGVLEGAFDIAIVRQVRLLLTTDRPQYQPGQRIHARVLALDTAAGRVAAGADLRFRFLDGRGTLVLDERARTDAHGIAWTVLPVASPVNEGTYVVEAWLEAQGAVVSRARREVAVRTYRVPRLRVDLHVAAERAEPGTPLAGTVKATYAWGAPVRLAEVEVGLEAWRDEEGRPVSTLRGRTGANGELTFSLDVPSGLLAASAGHEDRLRLHASVREVGGERQAVDRWVPLTTSPLRLALVPEAGTLVAGVPQRVHVLAARLDGAPVATPVTIEVLSGHPSRSWSVQTDVRGLAAFELTPEPGTVRLALSPASPAGAGGRVEEELVVPVDGPGLLLRPDRARYRAGERVEVEIRARTTFRTAHVDLLQGDRHLQTSTAPLLEGRGRVALTLPPGAQGLLRLVGHALDPGGRPVHGTRWIYVHPVDGLAVGVTADRPEYGPRGTAQLSFQVTQGEGQPVASALGVAVVDTAALAVARDAVRIAGASLHLPEALLALRLSPSSLSLSLLTEAPRPGPADELEAAREILLAVGLRPPRLAAHRTTGPLALAGRSERVRRVVEPLLAAQAERLAAALRGEYQRRGCCPRVPPRLRDLAAAGHPIDPERLSDPWGRPLIVRAVGGDQPPRTLVVRSAGLDRRPGTADDLSGTADLRIPPCARICPSRGVDRDLEELDDLNQGFLTPEGEYLGGRGASAPSWQPPPRPGPPRTAHAPSPTRPAIPVRRYFPETLLVQPALLTDVRGRARLAVPLADNLTTWNVLALASTRDGRLGFGEGAFPVRSRFFATLSVPRTLAWGDRVTVPVAVHNHHPELARVEVRLALSPELRQGGDLRGEVEVPAGDVRTIRFVVEAARVGQGWIRATARSGARSDAVEQRVAVESDGSAVESLTSGWLDRPIRLPVLVPRQLIPASASLRVDVDPSPIAWTLAGLEHLIQIPGGCFEQTTSVSYPNVVILRLLREKEQLTRPVQTLARQALGAGYQRLASFEAAGGGFAAWSGDPASVPLTAYALHQLLEMRDLTTVDPELLRRAAAFLTRGVTARGALEPAPGSSACDPNEERLTLTAYGAWALWRAGERRPDLHDRVARFLAAGLPGVRHGYTLAMVALYGLARTGRRASLAPVLARLAALATERGNEASWSGVGACTITRSGGDAAGQETTAIAARALLAAGGHEALASRAVSHLLRQRWPQGGWASPQATVLTLQALLEEHLARRRAPPSGRVEIWLGGRLAGRLTLDPGSSATRQQQSLDHLLRPGLSTTLELRYVGSGQPSFRAAARGFRHAAWDPALANPPDAPLWLEVSPDRTTLAPGERVRTRVSVRNRGTYREEMPMLVLGRAAGLEPVSGEWDGLVESGRIARYELGDRRIVVYLRPLAPGARLDLVYDLIASEPGSVLATGATAYPYYDARRVSRSAPVQFTVSSPRGR